MDSVCLSLLLLRIPHTFPRSFITVSPALIPDETNHALMFITQRASVADFALLTLLLCSAKSIAPFVAIAQGRSLCLLIDSKFLLFCIQVTQKDEIFDNPNVRIFRKMLKFDFLNIRIFEGRDRKQMYSTGLDYRCFYHVAHCDITFFNTEDSWWL